MYYSFTFLLNSPLAISHIINSIENCFFFSLSLFACHLLFPLSSLFFHHCASISVLYMIFCVRVRSFLLPASLNSLPGSIPCRDRLPSQIHDSRFPIKKLLFSARSVYSVYSLCILSLLCFLCLALGTY